MSTALDMKNIPQHVAIIMDGNGRWAKERGQARLFGHNAGMEALREIVRHSQKLGVKYLTVYAFSTENWKRSADEVSGIFKLLIKYFNSEIKELNDNNVRVKILGDWSKIPKESAKAVQSALDTTSNNTGLVFSIALNYGGRDDIVHAVKTIAAQGRDLSSITEADISSALYTEGIPDPELIIRTSGELRISNFLIWQAAYSEIVVTPVLWPDFTPEVYEDCILQYQGRDRRFGGVK